MLSTTALVAASRSTRSTKAALAARPAVSRIETVTLNWYWYALSDDGLAITESGTIASTIVERVAGEGLGFRLVAVGTEDADSHAATASASRRGRTLRKLATDTPPPCGSCR